MGGHGKAHNKTYVTAKEMVEIGQSKGEGYREFIKKAQAPFYCCAISMQPFIEPVASPDGTVFDKLNIMQYLAKHHKHPFTDEKLSMKDLIPLHFHKNTSGAFHCPLTFRTFTNHSHIVAIRTSGNVYSWDAVEQLNIKANNWNDSLTGEPFTKKDIFDIQNSIDDRAVEVATLKRVSDEAKSGQKVQLRDTMNVNSTTRRVLEEMGKKDPASFRALPEDPAAKRLKTDAVVESGPQKVTNISTGRVAASFTSTGMVPVTKTETIIVNKPKRPRRKGYVQMQTTLGTLNIELHCDLAPLACENFIVHCQKGYYNNAPFHRSIKNFMIQGGDPTGTGRGGDSIWGKPFNDEFTQKLTHGAQGVLSMANSGKNTNKSQFFILYQPAPHLDFKHTVFGRVVGGLEHVRAMERIETDSGDKPKVTVRIISTTVLVNPYDDPDIYDDDDDIAQKKQDAIAEKKRQRSEVGQWFSNPIQAMEPTRASATVGKYLPTTSTAVPQTKSSTSSMYGHFDQW